MYEIVLNCLKLKVYWWNQLTNETTELGAENPNEVFIGTSLVNSDHVPSDLPINTTQSCVEISVESPKLASVSSEGFIENSQMLSENISEMSGSISVYFEEAGINSLDESPYYSGDTVVNSLKADNKVESGIGITSEQDDSQVPISHLSNEIAIEAPKYVKRYLFLST